MNIISVTTTTLVRSTVVVPWEDERAAYEFLMLLGYHVTSSYHTDDSVKLIGEQTFTQTTRAPGAGPTQQKGAQNDIEPLRQGYLPLDR